MKLRRKRERSVLWMAYTSGAMAAALVWLIIHSGGTGAGSEAERSAGAGAVEVTMTEIQGLVAPPAGAAAGTVTEIQGQVSPSAETNYNQPMIRVYLSQARVVEKVTLEDYVRGVVAAEMPLEFEPAALEAQALAARTYIIRRLWLNDRTGMPVNNADVTDTQAHQVYKSQVEMKRLKMENEAGWQKIDEAVSKTAGNIITYGDEPIEALFFSTSNGYTENSEEVFPAKLPYLRSVVSPWDKEGSPRVQEKVEMPLSDFYTKLGVKALAVGGRLLEKPAIRIIEWTEGHRVKLMLAGSKKLTGEEVRQLLGLRSASFDWTIGKDSITLTTYGSGHGVGMSQWGAEGMAKAGKSAQQIVEYYYSGTRLERVSKLVNSSGKRL